MKRASLVNRIRHAWRELRSPSKRNVFMGARLSRLELDWIASTIAADEEIKRDGRRLRARARELARNDAFAKHYLRLLCVNVIGPSGFDHQAEVRNNAGVLVDWINDRIEEKFREWSESVTLDGRMGLVRFMHQQIRTVATDGEALIRKWRGPEFRHGLALEPIDVDLLDETLNVQRGADTPEIRMGIEIDRFARPTAYWVWNRPLEFGGSRERMRIPAADVLHLYDPDRVNQSRGVTWFHAVMLPMRFLGAYSESELVAARIAAAKMGIWQRRENMAGSEQPTGSGPQIEEANPGSFGFAPDGYELSNWDPQHPSTAYGEFVKQQLRQISTGLGVSYEALTSDLADATYSSMKAGRQNERDVWRMYQNWWVESFLNPVYSEWIEQALLVGQAGGDGLSLDTRSPQKFRSVRWSGRGWQSPDPVKDMDAAVAAIENGMGTRTAVLAEMGLDFDDVIERLAKEQERAKELGVSISASAAKANAAKSSPPPPEDDDEEEESEPEETTNGRLKTNPVLTGAD